MPNIAMSTVKKLGSVLPHNKVSHIDLKKANGSEYIKEVLLQSLPEKEKQTLNQELSWTFILDKHSTDSKTKKTKPVKKNSITRKERKKLCLLKLPKTGWNYESLEPMRAMWREYMKENLNDFCRIPKCTDSDWSTVSAVLAKSEFVGAETEVVRSKVPSQVGVKGTIVLETKMTFQLITPHSQLKTLIKESCVFEIRLGNLRLTIFGKHLVTRPGERSTKKIKSQMIPDL